MRASKNNEDKVNQKIARVVEKKMHVADLNAAPWNPRKISADQLKRLAKSMAQFGDLGGVVQNQRTGNLVGGHQRVRVLDKKWPIRITKRYKQPNEVGTLAEGMIETPWGEWSYRLVDWDERTEQAAAIAANHHGGDDDLPKLKELIGELDDGQFDMDLLGFVPVVHRFRLVDAAPRGGSTRPDPATRAAGGSANGGSLTDQ